MENTFSQVPIFDRIISYFDLGEMLNFMTVNQAVYQMFMIPSNKNKLEEMKQMENITRIMMKANLDRWADLFQDSYSFDYRPLSYFYNIPWNLKQSLTHHVHYIPPKPSLADSIIDDSDTGSDRKKKEKKKANKDNAKYNRIMQNKMYKKHYKR